MKAIFSYTKDPIDRFQHILKFCKTFYEICKMLKNQETVRKTTLHIAKCSTAFALQNQI